jgi:two-component system, chemotaxis family, sensor kinase CheA
MPIHDDEKLMRELLQTFQAEASEHVQSLNQTILELEREAAVENKAALIQEAFRSAHSLKGAARAVALSEIEALAHRMEDVLKLARDGKLSLEPAICDVLYITLDGIEALLKKQTIDVQALLARFETILPHENGHHPENGNQHENMPGIQTVQHHEFHGKDDDSIRVALTKLDSLMAEAGELALSRINAEQRSKDLQNMRQAINRFPRLWQDVRVQLSRLQRENHTAQPLIEVLESYHKAVQGLLTDVANVDLAMNRDAVRLGMVTNRLQDDIRRVRMLPFQSLEALLHRTVRDAARTARKEIDFSIEGMDVELDRKVLELLKDPLIHLLRNAAVHGIESPEMRLQKGKAALGHVKLSIAQRGSEAHIRIWDDGQGFQIDALKSAANGHPLAPNHSDDPVRLAFLAGVSTANGVDELAGRGVGLDVVRQQIELLQGRISVENKPDEGVAIQLFVPISLAMTRVLLVNANKETYAIPLASIEMIEELENSFHVEGQLMINVNNQPLVVVPLAVLLGQSLIESPDPLLIILAVAEQKIALLVDDVLSEQELAVKSFSKPLVKVRHMTGAAVLGNGEPVVVLNTADLVKASRKLPKQAYAAQKEIEQKEEAKHLEHILVVDDSITTRTLEKNILVAAGYKVVTATDGLEALKELSKQHFDLVVTDVEMPNLNGINLCQQLRENDEFKELPVILVTSLESKDDRERGMRAGANAYIVKRGFNQAELLTTIRQLL